MSIIIAISALHSSNTELAPNSPASGDPVTSAPRRIWTGSPQDASHAYADALKAWQSAIRALRTALADVAFANIDAALAAVLCFIQFELMSAGRNEWMFHVRGTRALIARLCGPGPTRAMEDNPLRSCLVFNCVV